MGSSKRVVNNTKYIVGGDTSGNITGPAVKIEGIDVIGFQVSWTGTPTGTLTLQISNDGDVWATSGAAATGNPAGGAANGFIELSTAAAFARLVFTGSGAGSLDSHVVGKSLS